MASAALLVGNRRDALTGWGVALLCHLLLALWLCLLQGEWVGPEPPPRTSAKVSMHLVPPPEGPRGASIAASLPGSENEPPEEQDQPAPSDGDEPQRPDPAPTPEPAPPPARVELEEAVVRELEAEREQLRAQLEQQKNQTTSFADRVREQLNTGGGADQQLRRPVPAGTIRELELDGYNEAVVAEIMARYGLRITEKALAGGVSQSFLSSAATADGGQFAADRDGAPGVYQVFLLSPKAVARMSQLEEEELRRRGFDPMKTRVLRVKFGIVGPPTGADLGVLVLEAEPLK